MRKRRRTIKIMCMCLLTVFTILVQCAGIHIGPLSFDGIGVIEAQAWDKAGEWILYKGQDDKVGTTYTDLQAVFNDAYNWNGAGSWSRIHCKKSGTYDIGATNPGFNLNGSRTLVLTAEPSVTCEYASGSVDTYIFKIFESSTLYVGDGVTLKQYNGGTTVSMNDTSSNLYVAGVVASENALCLVLSAGTLYKLNGGSVTVSTRVAGSSSVYTCYKMTLSKGTGVSTVSPSNTYLSLPYLVASEYWYQNGLSVAVSATASTGYSITGGTGSYTMNQNQSVGVTATLNTYSISYTLNGGINGTNAPTAATYNADVSVTNPTRTGYTFAGWTISNCTTDTTHYYGTSTSYGNTSVAASFTTTATHFKNLRSSAGIVTLTANWTALSSDITLNSDGGSGGSTSVTATYDSDMSNVTVPTKQYYIFRGYYTQKDGQGTQYYNPDGSSTRVWNIVGNTELFAYWIENKNQVTVDPKGGSWTDTNGDTFSVPHTFEQYGDSKMTIPSPTRAGYTFVRWEIVAGTGGKIEGNTYTFDVGTAVTLEAKWGPKPVTSFEKDTEAQVQSKENRAADLSKNFETFVEEDNKGITQEDMINSQRVELNLKVTDIDKTAPGATDIKNVAQGEVVQYYDITVTKILTNGSDNAVSEVTLKEIPKAVQVIIPIEGELVGKSGYAVYRYHDGIAERLSVDSKAEEYYAVSEDNTQIIISTRKFSTYGVVINEIAIKDTKETYNSGDVDVQGRIRQGAEATYKLDITWGAMAFEYETGRYWDTEKHAYDGEKVDLWRPEGYKNGNNKIVIANHSNADVFVDFNTSSLIEGVDLAIKEENAEDAADVQNLLIEKVPTEGAAALEKSVFLRLLGVPFVNAEAQIDEVKRLKELNGYAKAGVITITVRSNTESDVITPRDLSK